MDLTLKRNGGSLQNLVTMTVFINDPRHGDEFVKLRRAIQRMVAVPRSAEQVRKAKEPGDGA